MSSNDVDPFLLEVLKSGLDTIADEMALVLMRTAYSGIVRDSMDFSTAVCDAEGQTLAQGLTHRDASRQLLRRDALSDHDAGRATSFPTMSSSSTIRTSRRASIFRTSTSSSRSSTRISWSRGRRRSRITPMSAASSPGSNALGAVEIYQEGIRIPIVKFMERGKPVDARLADRRAQCAAA